MQGWNEEPHQNKNPSESIKQHKIQSNWERERERRTGTSKRAWRSSSTTTNPSSEALETEIRRFRQELRGAFLFAVEKFSLKWLLDWEMRKDFGDKIKAAVIDITLMSFSYQTNKHKTNEKSNLPREWIQIIFLILCVYPSTVTIRRTVNWHRIFIANQRDDQRSVARRISMGPTYPQYISDPGTWIWSSTIKNIHDENSAVNSPKFPICRPTRGPWLVQIFFFFFLFLVFDIK